MGEPLPHVATCGSCTSIRSLFRSSGSGRVLRRTSSPLEGFRRRAVLSVSVAEVRWAWPRSGPIRLHARLFRGSQARLLFVGSNWRPGSRLGAKDSRAHTLKLSQLLYSGRVVVLFCVALYSLIARMREGGLGFGLQLTASVLTPCTA